MKIKFIYPAAHPTGQSSRDFSRRWVGSNYAPVTQPYTHFIHDQYLVEELSKEEIVPIQPKDL